MSACMILTLVLTMRESYICVCVNMCVCVCLCVWLTLPQAIEKHYFEDYRVSAMADAPVLQWVPLSDKEGTYEFCVEVRSIARTTILLPSCACCCAYACNHTFPAGMSILPVCGTLRNPFCIFMSAVSKHGHTQGVRESYRLQRLSQRSAAVAYVTMADV